MKPTEESADTLHDFGDEATSVMGGDLLSSLTERSRRIDVGAQTMPEPLPDPEIGIDEDEPEPVTTMRPVAPLPPLVAEGEYPALGDEESTIAMEEPEPTTVAVRLHADRPAPVAPPPIPAPLAAPIVEPLPAPAAPDPQWAAELKPRVLETIRVPKLPPPELEPERASQPAAGSRVLSLLAAVALGVAAWTVGLGHHEAEPAPAVIASPSPSNAAAKTPEDPAHAKLHLALDRR